MNRKNRRCELHQDGSTQIETEFKVMASCPISNGLEYQLVWYFSKHRPTFYFALEIVETQAAYPDLLIEERIPFDAEQLLTLYPGLHHAYEIARDSLGFDNDEVEETVNEDDEEIICELEDED